jgi:hypothetical protein
MNLKECIFGSKEVAYLAFQLTKEGIKPGTNELIAITNALISPRQCNLALLQVGHHAPAALLSSLASHPCSPSLPSLAMSVDLLNAIQLSNLFNAAQVKAKVNQCQLLISHPSDLFQIKVSYCYDRQYIKLILNIPPSDSILRLFQLHPFLLPFTKTHFSLPRPTSSLRSHPEWITSPRSSPSST